MDKNTEQNQKMPASVMLIDDDKFLLEMTAMKFDKLGIKTMSYIKAEDALTALRGGDTPDIILFDLIMPKMDGYSFAKKVEEEKLSPNSLKIVFSNQARQADVDMIEKIDVQGHIIKALYTPSEVCKEVLKIFNNHKK